MAERETEDTVLICFFLMLSLVKLLVLRQRAEEELHRSNCTSYFPNIVLIHVTMNMDTDLIAVFLKWQAVTGSENHTTSE